MQQRLWLNLGCWGMLCFWLKNPAFCRLPACIFQTRCDKNKTIFWCLPKRKNIYNSKWKSSVKIVTDLIFPKKSSIRSFNYLFYHKNANYFKVQFIFLVFSFWVIKELFQLNNNVTSTKKKIFCIKIICRYYPDCHNKLKVIGKWLKIKMPALTKVQ